MATRTNILAVGTGDATSADQSVDSGSQLTLQLIGPNSGSIPRDATVTIELKGSDGTYRSCHSLELSGTYERSVQLQGPLAAFRVHRVAGNCGVDVVA